MDVAKVFSNGETQLIALPKNFRFSDEEVFVNRFGDAIVLIPKKRTLSETSALLDLFTEDFMSDDKKELTQTVCDVP